MTDGVTLPAKFALAPRRLRTVRIAASSESPSSVSVRRVLSVLSAVLRSPDDSQGAALLRQLALGPLDARDAEPTAVHYSNFFSPLAFPISASQPGVARLVADSAASPAALHARAAGFITPELCPLKGDVLWTERWFDVKLPKGRTKAVLVSLTHSAAVRVDGTTIDPSECRPELTPDGFRLSEKYAFESDEATASLFVNAISAGISPLVALLPLLSSGGTLANAITAPNLILPIVLLNAVSFPLPLARRLFAIFVRERRHHFLVRALVLAELAQTPPPLLFEHRTRCSRPILVVFCAGALEWTDALLGNLAADPTVEPVRLLRALLKACANLPPMSAYVVRALLILALLTIGEVRSVFAVFLRFIAHVFRLVMRAKGITQPQVTCIVSQLLIGVERDGGAAAEAMRSFKKFLERVIREMPEIPEEESGEEELEAFVRAKETEVCAGIREFMDQATDQHILTFSFSQNFRFLGRERG
jgi:hypothetical protein